MSVVRGVRVVDPDGNERVYPEARTITRDGYMDYEFRDARGVIIATRKKDSVEETETLYT